MPWQSHAAHLGLEMVETPEGLLIPAFREVICTVMRQSGKSTLLFSLFAHRSTMWQSLPQRSIYTAQDGSAARRKLIDDMAPMYQESKLFSKLVSRVYKGVGNESIDFKTGSTIRTIGSSEAAGHGMTSIGMAGIDESFADLDFRREQALQPSMATVADAQTWNVSTAGTERSVYLRKKIEDGRAAVAEGRTTGLAYIEYSIPDDADCDNPETWWEFMPALGWTISEEVVGHARLTMPDGEWRRSFGNQWTVTDERVIPVGVWGEVCSEDVAPSGRLVFALDVNPERSAAAVAVADSEGRGELVEFRSGVGWVVDRVVELCRKWEASVRLDAYSPAGSLADELVARGVRVDRYATREVSYACGSFFDRLMDRKVQVRRHAALDEAAAGARRRSTGDSWVWARKDAECDVSPLIALTLALDVRAAAEPELWVAFE
jgi:hypothetical protein